MLELDVVVVDVDNTQTILLHSPGCSGGDLHAFFEGVMTTTTTNFG